MRNFDKKMFNDIRQWSGRLGFNPRSSHTKDSKIVFYVVLLKTQHFKVKQSRENNSTLLYT